jgi:hypothetical protein
MSTSNEALTAIPDGLRTPLIDEYNSIIRNYMDSKWTPSELSGGRFCEIIYTILHGFGTGSYAPSPMKPSNFVAACRALESLITNPRSFQILIPRMLPPLYEIRNNRGVGHVGGDVDPNHIDATAVISMTSWIMAELVRVFHNLSIRDAQKLTDSLVDRRIPLVWQSDNIRRVLRPDLPLRDQTLILISSVSGPVNTDDLFCWTGYSKRSYFNSILRKLHNSRYVELGSDERKVELLPPGTAYVEQLISSLA